MPGSLSPIARPVRDNLLTSPTLPAARIEVSSDFHYAGSHDFVLYEVAHAQQHLFVDARPDGRVSRLLWLQFEGYREDNDRTYSYAGSTPTEIGGLPFLVDFGVAAMDSELRDNPRSDGAHAARFLAERGFQYAGDTVFARLVWLDEPHRNELMIIYSEDARLVGLDRPAFRTIDTAGPQWRALCQGLGERALESFRLR